MKPIKSFLRGVLGRTVKQRLAGSYPAYALARQLVEAYENRDVEMTTNGEHWFIRQSADRGTITAIDVGANKGDWAGAVLQCQPEARLLCFEPVPATYATLEKSIAGPNVALFNQALSSRPGALTVYSVPDNPHIASVYAGDYFQPELERQAIQIEATTGEAVLSDAEIDRVDIVKIDAEGHDYEVLLGFENAVRTGQVDFFQFEYNILTLEGGRSLRDFFTFFAPDYVLCRLLPNGLEAFSYHPTLDNFAQSNWIAVRAEMIDHDIVSRFSMRRARGLGAEGFASLYGSQFPQVPYLVK